MKRIAVFTTVFMIIASFVSAQEKSFKYDDHGKRDPLWKLVSSRGTIINYDRDLLITDMAVEGIIGEGDGDNIAIINGTIVKANDKIGAYVIKEITFDKVILAKEGKEYILKLKKED